MNTERLLKLNRLIVSHGFLIAFILALLVRLCALSTQQVIATDGIRHIAQARLVSDGQWSLAFGALDFNLYPVLIAAAHGLLGPAFGVSFESCGLLLNFVCGMVLLFPLFALARHYFGKVPAFAAAVYLALLPSLVTISTSVLREGPFLCAIAWAVYLFMMAIQDLHPSEWLLERLILAGMLLFLAATIRTEALGLLACMGFTLLVAHAGATRGYSFKRRFSAGFALVILALFLAVPVLGYASYRSGKLQFLKLDKLAKPYVLGSRPTRATDPIAVSKVDMFDASGNLIPDEVVRVNWIKMAKRNQGMIYAGELLSAFAESFGYAGLALAGVGIWLLGMRRVIRMTDPLVPYFVSTTLLLGAVFVRYVKVQYYLSDRHMLALTLPMAIFVAVPFAYVAIVQERIRQMAAIVLAGVVVYFAATDVWPENRHFVPFRRCGEALASSLPADATLAGPNLIALYYADRPYALFYPTLTNLPAECTGSNSYLVVDLENSSQSNYVARVASRVERVPARLPKTTKHDFALFRPVGATKPTDDSRR